MRTYTYNVRVERDEDGVYIVEAPALDGCFTDGRTYDEALANIQEAIQAHLGLLVKRGEPIPNDNEPSSGMSVSVVAPDQMPAWAGSHK